MAYQKGMVRYSDVQKIVTKKDLQYLILLGQRSNGKSYAVKELCVRNAFSAGEQFIYLRRYDEDTKEYNTELYFDDLNVEEITSGKYNGIEVYRRRIYFCMRTEDEKVRGDCIGHVISLNKAERNKSLSYGKVSAIIYEEFITDNVYLSNEVDRLAQLVSTVFRDRNGIVYLIGNTISRICPYFSEWQLIHINKQKKGTVDIYEYDERVKIGVYLTDSLQSESGMFFGRSAKMINKGEWATGEYPHIIGSVEDYTIAYTVIYKHDNHVFMLQLLSGYEHMQPSVVWFISPKTSDIKKYSRVVSSKPVLNTIWSRDFNTPINEDERRVFNILNNGYVCFSDNLTATEFYQCLQNESKGARR